MRIAIAADGDNVSAHFGHCARFAVYSVAGGVAKHEEDLVAPPHEPGVFPTFLAENQVNLVIAGGMGPKAVDLFKAKGIEVLLGVSGGIPQAAEAYAEGRLQAGESTCHH